MSNLIRFAEVVTVVSLVAWIPLSLAASFLVMGQVKEERSRLRTGFNPLGARRETLTPLGWRVLVAYRWYLGIAIAALLVAVIANLSGR